MSLQHDWLTLALNMSGDFAHHPRQVNSSQYAEFIL